MTVLVPSVLANGNWFLLALAVPVTCLVALTHPRCRVHLGHVSRSSRTRQSFLWGLLVTSSALLVLGLSLEIYHAQGCPTSAIFRYETENVARFLYEFCRRHQVPYWAAFGNLLFILRGEHRIPVGDTDSDIGVVKDDFMVQVGSLKNFSALVRKEAYLELQRPVHVMYDAERDLVQLYLDRARHGPHADIWFYRVETDAKTGIKWLVNTDRTIRGKRVRYDHVLPLETERAFFLNVPVILPRNMSYLARVEYGSDYMTPRTTRMECIENVVNGYTFYKLPFVTRLRYATTCVVLVAALTLIAVHSIPSLSRALQIKMGSRPQAHETAAPRASDKYVV
ncbi:hypothetical protein PsorP6_011052 [Peronosclerospora sorghi]|uniref:Uncharacterized protein n=1 Tax=Peronosclerospora sorghi TaxID=230839 RepID=A0ACC0VWX8_9STRA|nr:hypothetical protein PsorP6_011052 [Peronosclerospora sorghi]